jgi:D-glycero-alpha-D-manno-heptose-7-phosphate kinase
LKRPVAGPAHGTRLRLLSLLVHFFEGHGITLTTTSESPAGAGIAGSSALNVAVCAALADWSRDHYEPEALLQIAMNVEAQAINVPTGLQDYRPALYGGIAPSSSTSTASAACRSTWTPKELQRRIVLCYTGEPRNSGTNNWEITKKHHRRRPHIFDCFEADPRHGADDARGAARGDWDGVGAASPTSGKPQAARPGVTTPAIDS